MDDENFIFTFIVDRAAVKAALAKTHDMSKIDDAQVEAVIKRTTEYLERNVNTRLVESFTRDAADQADLPRKRR